MHTEARIRKYTGRYFDILNLQAKDVSIIDTRETIEICSLPPTNSSATWSIPFSAPTNATAPLTRLANFERYGLRVLYIGILVWNAIELYFILSHSP